MDGGDVDECEECHSVLIPMTFTAGEAVVVRLFDDDGDFTDNVFDAVAGVALLLTGPYAGCYIRADVEPDDFMEYVYRRVH